MTGGKDSPRRGGVDKEHSRRVGLAVVTRNPGKIYRFSGCFRVFHTLRTGIYLELFLGQMPSSHLCSPGNSRNGRVDTWTHSPLRLKRGKTRTGVYYRLHEVHD